MKVMVLVAKGFEEIELVTPVDILRRAGLQVDLVSISSNTEVISAHGIKILADYTLDAVNPAEYGVIFLPGGEEGSDNLKKSVDVASILKSAASKGALLVAICAAPTVFAAIGLLKGKNATSYPAMRAEVEASGALYSEEAVVRDGNIITSRGPGTSAKLAYYLVETLVDAETAKAWQKGMLFA
jgi:protein deglycase